MPMRFTMAMLVVAVVIVSTFGQAFAGDLTSGFRFKPVTSDKTLTTASEDSSKSASSERIWYGWQNLLVMGGSLGAAVIAGKAGSAEAALIIGAGGFYLGPPVIHWAHGNVGAGFVSLGIGAGGATVLGTAGAYLMCSGNRCDGEMGPLGALAGFLLGAFVGSIVYVIVDSTFLAYDDPPSPRLTTMPNFSPFKLTPQVWVNRDQTTFGFVGQF